MSRGRRTPHKRDPDLERAIAALTQGDAARAFALVRGVIQRKPSSAEAHYALGLAAPRVGRLDEGVRALRKAVDLDGRRAIYHYALGTALQDMGDFEAAVEAFTRAGWLDRSLADCHADAASALERLGRVDEAAKSVERALKADPSHARAQVMSARIELRGGKPDADRLETLRGILDPITRSQEAPLTRSLAWEALGDIADRSGDATAAFAAFTECNRIERARQHCPADADRATYLRSIDELMGAMTREAAERWRAEVPDDGVPAPAILVGFPRSGTTMTERALDAHPRVRSIEEKPTFDALRGELVRLKGPEIKSRPFAEAMDGLTTDEVAHLREAYWNIAAEHLGERPDDGTVVLDKLPLRLVTLPWINRVFPDARVLVALRDPRDVCLSCFRQRFTLNPPMSFFLDLSDTARLYEAAMGAWVRTRDAYTFAWKEFRYEEVVSGFEDRMRELVAFLGVEWDDAVLSFHEKPVERASLTPSYHAVRRKVNTRAVGRHVRYSACLAPIIPTLAPFLEQFGYETADGGTE